MTELNDIIKCLGEEYGAQLVEMDKYFCTPEGQPVLRYFGKDKIHLSKSGIRRLLDSMEKICGSGALVENFEQCVYGRSPRKQGFQQPKYQRPRSQPNRGNRRMREHHGQTKPNSKNHQSCVKCGESNHSTFDCKHRGQIKCHSCRFLGHKQSRCPNH